MPGKTRFYSILGSVGTRKAMWIIQSYKRVLFPNLEKEFNLKIIVIMNQQLEHVKETREKPEKGKGIAKIY